MELIIRRGVLDRREIFEALGEIKAGQIAPAISDGFL
jgi:hypothetical protein